MQHLRERQYAELPFWVLPLEQTPDLPVIGMHLETGILVCADTMMEWQDALRLVKEREGVRSKTIEFGSTGPGGRTMLREHFGLTYPDRRELCSKSV